MRRTELTHRMARRAQVTPAEAADQLDRMIHQILVSLRKGEPAKLPGLGVFRPGEGGAFQFAPATRSKPHEK